MFNVGGKKFGLLMAWLLEHLAGSGSHGFTFDMVEVAISCNC